MPHSKQLIRRSIHCTAQNARKAADWPPLTPETIASFAYSINPGFLHQCAICLSALATVPLRGATGEKGLAEKL